ncbi:MAG: hypothetical protein ABIU11_04290, partial [Chitinophagaceae bacterium]
MKKAFLILLFVLEVYIISAQQFQADSLREQLKIAREDTTKVLLFNELSFLYVFSKPDSAFYYASEGLQMARKINYIGGESRILFILATYYRIKGYSSLGMQFANEALALNKTFNNAEGVIMGMNMLGWLAMDQNDYRRSLEYAFKAVGLSEKHRNYRIEYSYSMIAECYEHLNKFDSALIYAQKAESVPQDYNWNRIVLGRIHASLNNDSLSLQYYRKAISQTGFSKDSSDAFNGMAEVFNRAGQTDSAIYWAKRALGLAMQKGFLFEVLSASEMLTKMYKTNHLVDSTLKYMQITIEANDSLFSQGKVIQFQTLVFNEKLQQQQLEANKVQYQTRIRNYILLTVIGFFLVLSFILFRNNKLKQKVNAQLQQQKEKIETALSDLKITQTQLIQSEKMASLGELTAGIAHEIQNPLNFVNNFSEVNTELIDELKIELATGNTQQAIELANDIKENEQKINHHGKRADAIVKGMLQHSRSSSRIKEPTDINALCDEYLRLSYHGLRAKDKSFNATIKTDFDESIGNINIIPQDIGRVILNLLTNAFYAVNEKQKSPHPLKGGDEPYEPIVSVTT